MTLGGGLLEWWDAATGKQHVPPTPARERLEGSTFSPDTLTFSPNGKWLICGLPSFQSRRVSIHEVATGKLVGAPLAFETADGALKISPDGATLAALALALIGLREGRVQLWRTATSKLFGEPAGHEGEVTCLDVSPDGKLLATGGRDGTARLWDLSTGKPDGLAFRHLGQIAEVVFSPDSKLLATLDETGVVRLWNTAAQPAPGLPIYHTPATGYVLDPGGQWVMIFRELEMMRLDLATFRPIGKSIQFEEPFGSVACNPDGTLLAIFGKKGIQLWDIAAGKPHGQPIACEGNPHLAFVPDGKWLVAMSREGKIQMWETATGKIHYPPFEGDGAQAAAFDLQISADGKLVARRYLFFGLFLSNVDLGMDLPLDEGQLIGAMSRDGKVLMSADTDGGGLSILEPLTGRTVGAAAGGAHLPDSSGVQLGRSTGRGAERRPDRGTLGCGRRKAAWTAAGEPTADSARALFAGRPAACDRVAGRDPSAVGRGDRPAAGASLGGCRRTEAAGNHCRLPSADRLYTRQSPPGRSRCRPAVSVVADAERVGPLPRNGTTELDLSGGTVRWAGRLASDHRPGMAVTAPGTSDLGGIPIMT